MTNPFAQTRAVGKTGLLVPPMGLGAAHLGELYAKVAEPDARATLAAAWDGGIRYYDTAPWYGRGLSEHRLGGMLRTRPRDEFLVTTKVGRVLHRPADLKNFKRNPWVGGFNFEVEFDYSRDGIMRSYEQSLMRLGLDRLDALIIHDLDPEYAGEHLPAREKALMTSGIKALEELKARGEIKAIGMGINSAPSLTTTATLVDLDFVLVAMPYTLLDHASLGEGMAECVRRGVSVIVGAPFASGILATGSGSTAKYGYASASPEVQAKVRGLEAVCARHGVTLAAAALQFPLAHPAVVALIPGAARPEEVTENIASFSAPIPTDFWVELKAEGLIARDAPTPHQ